MIIGGGKAAYYLARQLLKMGISVKIIEIDKARCEELSTLLPKAIIINGDGTNEALLKEEGIEYTESFVPLTGIDEENILLTPARQTSLPRQGHHQNQPHHLQKRHQRTEPGQCGLSALHHLGNHHRLCSRRAQFPRQQHRNALPYV